MIKNFTVLLRLIFTFFLVAGGQALAQSSDTPESGPRVWKVSIQGNETFPDFVLKNIIATKEPSFWQKVRFGKQDGFFLSGDDLLRDAIRIERFYQRRGFPDVEVNPKINGNDDERKKKIIFEVQEGLPINIKSAETSILTTSADSAALMEETNFRQALHLHPYQPGKRYELIKEPDVRGVIIDELNDLGYPYAKVLIAAAVDSLQKQAQIKIQINPNQKAYFENIRIEGNETYPENYARRESGLEKGELYSDDKIQEAQRELFNNHAYRFSTIGFPEQPQDSTLDVVIRVRESSPRSVQLLGGVGTDANLDGKAINAWRLFRAQVSWTHRNVRRKGERFSATGRASFFEQRLSMDYLFPYIFNTKSSFLVTPSVQRLEERSFRVVRGGVNADFIYQYTRDFTTTLGYDFTANGEVQEGRFVDREDSVLNFDVSSFQLSAYYQRGFIRNQKGWVIQPFAEVSGTFGGGTFRFQKLSLDVRRYQPVARSLAVAARIETGVILETEQDSLPRTVLFFTGGTNSVRGWGRGDLGPKRPQFTEDPDGNIQFDDFIPIGGQAQLAFNFELRQQLNGFINGFSLAAFLDGGQVWRDPGQFDFSTLQYGAGIGLRYRSPIGPLRIDFARKLNPSDQDLNIFNGEGSESFSDLYRIHFSIGQAF